MSAAGGSGDVELLDALDILRPLAAPMAAIFTLAGQRGAWWHDRVAWRGEPRLERTIVRLPHRPFTRQWDPCAPPPTQVNQFHAGSEAPRRTHRGATPLHTWSVAARPTAHQRRALLYDADERFVAWVGLLRDDRPFAEEEDARLARLVEPLGRAVAARLRALDAACPDAGEVLLDASGRVTLASPGLEAWLTPARTAALATPEARAVAGMVAEPRPLAGPGGAHTLWLLRKAVRPRISPLGKLGPRAREVVDCVAAGATLAETARHLDIAEDTARDHLRRAYELLGVASRAELAHLVAHARTPDGA